MSCPDNPPTDSVAPSEAMPSFVDVTSAQVVNGDSQSTPHLGAMPLLGRSIVVVVVPIRDRAERGVEAEPDLVLAGSGMAETTAKPTPSLKAGLHYLFWFVLSWFIVGVMLLWINHDPRILDYVLRAGAAVLDRFGL